MHFQNVQAIASPSVGIQLQGHPRVLWVGIGCQRCTPTAVIEQAIQQVFEIHHLAAGAIAGLATIDHKVNEVGLVEYCRDFNLPLKCFSAEALQAIAVPNPSTRVNSKVATPSVAEAAAILATSNYQNLSHLKPNARHLKPETCYPNPLIVSKQIFRLTDHPGAVTIAIAQAEQEYTEQVFPMTEST